MQFELPIAMAVEPNDQLEQLKSILGSLPVSKAAAKKTAGLSHDESIKATPEKVAQSEKDNSLPEAQAKTSDLVENDQEVPRLTGSRITCSQSPVSFLLEYVQKCHNLSPVVWDELSKNGLFGCKVSVGSKFWIAAPTYSRKKEARTMAALMACTELLGNGLIFETVDLNKYESWTKESVRKVSDELALKEDIIPSQEIDSAGNDSGEKALVPLHSSPLESTGIIASKNISYVALLNEKCQKLRIPLPEYAIYTVKYASGNKFVCSISNFEGFPDVRTDAMQSIRVAKNEAARQLCELLRINVSNIDSAPISSTPRKYTVDEIVPWLITSFNVLIESSADPSSLIPSVMQPVAHLSRACYPDKSSIDGIYKLVDQWKVFLDWKEQQNKL